MQFTAAIERTRLVASWFPSIQVSTFRRKQAGLEGEDVYARTSNPTRTALEAALAALEDGERGLAFGSGMAAITSVVLSLLSQGDHVVALEDLYGGSRRLFDRIMCNFGVSFTYVQDSTPRNFENAMKPETKIVWVETPTNPLLQIVDIQMAVEVAHRRHALLVVDNTFASPYKIHSNSVQTSWFIARRSISADTATW